MHKKPSRTPHLAALFVLTATIGLASCAAQAPRHPAPHVEPYKVTLKKLDLEHQRITIGDRTVTIDGAVRNRSNRHVADVRMKLRCTSHGKNRLFDFSTGSGSMSQDLRPGSALRFAIELPTMGRLSSCGKASITGFSAAND